jgi:hypothetical protein
VPLSLTISDAHYPVDLEAGQRFMDITCPSCGKANQSTPCLRCGADLSPLFAVCRAALGELSVAGKCLRSGQVEEAYSHATQSWELYQTPEAARLAFLACLARDDFAWSRIWYHRVVTPHSKSRVT